MRLGIRSWLLTAFLVASTGCPVLAQTVNFVPETDFHLKLNSFMRVYLQAKDDRDAGASDQFSIGPSVQFYLRPLLKLKKITAFDLDDSKARPLVLEVGYRVLVAPNTPSTNRMQPMLTFHLPLVAGILMSDRNRADLDWKSGTFTWRYRNKLTLERGFEVNSYHFIPYIAAEPYYEEQYHKWSTTDLYAGCLFPVGKHVQVNPYYEHENNTGTQTSKPKTYIGLAMYLFFSVAKE